MSNFDAVYQATLNCLRGDYMGVFERAVRDAHSVEWWRVQHEFSNAAIAMQETHVLMRPKLFMDGSSWCALYGENLMEGVAGFGKSPAEAMADFDRNWNKKITTQTGEK